jgi:hypothetical protein
MHYHGYQKRSNHFLKKKHENNFAHNLEIFSSSFHDCRNWNPAYAILFLPIDFRGFPEANRDFQWGIEEGTHL